MGTVGLGIRTALAMQEGDALNAFALTGLALAALLRRARLLVPLRLRRGIITTAAAGTARAFRARCRVMSPGFMASGFVSSGISPGILGPGAVAARGGPSAPVLRRTLRGGRYCIAGARRAA